MKRLPGLAAFEEGRDLAVREVVFATDLSSFPAQALPCALTFALAFALAFGARLTALHVVPDRAMLEPAARPGRACSCSRPTEGRTTMSETRRDVRIPSVNLVSVARRDAEGAATPIGLGTTSDVSEHGIKLTLREPVEKGEVLQVEFIVGGEIVRAEARVMNVEEVRQYRVGLRFLDLGGEHRARVLRYIEERGIAPGAAVEP